MLDSFLNSLSQAKDRILLHLELFLLGSRKTFLEVPSY